ncbi:MAG: TetR/AcrR family transcriptional regulator [Clostridia bacterium]|nr:TetR/AcrR family transcriptional regulator [Clostridia bacterium]
MDDLKNAEYPAKRKILNAAREVFAERGYDGASISEIAKRAGVNKALPFYYFESKENILKEVIRFGAKETLERKEAFMRSSKDPNSKEFLEEYYEYVLAAIEAKKEIVKIMLLESLKGPGESNLLFEFLDPILKGAVNHLKNMGKDIEDLQRLMTTEVFFDAIPLFMFVALGEKWSKHSQIDEEKVRQDFLFSFKNIYVAYVYKKYFDDKK